MHFYDMPSYSTRTAAKSGGPTVSLWSNQLLSVLPTVCPDCTTWGRWEARTRSIQLTVEREVSRHVSGRPIEIRWLTLCSCTSARSAWWVQRGQERIKFCGDDHLFVGVDITIIMNTVCTCCFHAVSCISYWGELLPNLAYDGRGLRVHETKLCIHKLCNRHRLVLRWFLTRNHRSTCSWYDLWAILLGPHPPDHPVSWCLD